MKKKCEGSQHNFDKIGKCSKCGRMKYDLWLKSMNEDIPRCNSKSINELERNSGKGFWGNATTGYVYDKDNK